MWCYKMAHQKHHSDQQIDTIDKIISMTSGEQGQYLIFDDVLTPATTDVKKYRKSATGDWLISQGYKQKWLKLDK